MSPTTKTMELTSATTSQRSTNYHCYTTSHADPLTLRDVQHVNSGSLRRVLPNSPNTENPNQNASLLKPRMPFKLAAFNVRTLRQTGQQAGLARTLETMKVDICCLSETRLYDPSTVINLPSPSDPCVNFRLRVSGDQEAQETGLAGVGIALSSRAEAALIDWIPVNSRMCAVRLRGSCKISHRRQNTRALFVIAAYAPTDCSADSCKDEFYRGLDELLRKARKSDIIILAGDLNARIGRLSQSERYLGGPYGLDCVRSDNGERLLTLCAEHHLFLCSVNFRHSKQRSATWKSPSTGLRTQIDHIAISYRWRSSVQDCRSYWSTCISSDHALVCASLTMRFSGTPKKNTAKLNTLKLSDRSVANEYTTALSNALRSHPDDVEEHWTHIQSAMYHAGLESCGTSKRMASNWISAATVKLIDQQRSLPAGDGYAEQRRQIRRQLKISLQSDRESWWEERAGEMEAAQAAGNTRKLFQLIRSTGPRLPSVSELITEVDGSLITSRERRMDRWMEHFAAQFNQPASSFVSQWNNSSAEWPVSQGPPTEAEIRAHILKLKRRKAPGLDDLPAELFIEGIDVLCNELTLLFSKVWDKETIPSSWGASAIVPVYKKGSRKDCGNHRGISLIPVVSKLFASIILTRLSSYREAQYREEQTGFRGGRGCIDQIFTLRQTLELRHQYNRPTIVVFLDIRAAFDSIDRTALWDCLTRHGVPAKYVRLIKELYCHTTGRVKVYGDFSKSFAISSGVRQGCPISPFLFNFAIDDVMRKTANQLPECGIDLLPGRRLMDLDYADDIALLGEDASSIQSALNLLADQLSLYGLRFSPSKCKVLLQDWPDPTLDLSIGNHNLEVTDSFTYLGSCITAGCEIDNEITGRIARARHAFAGLRHLWRRRDVGLRLKGRVYQATVRAVLLYGCETWTLRQADNRRLSTFDHRCLRSIARVSWQDRVRNDDVRRSVLGEHAAPLSDHIAMCQLRWLGHVLRMAEQRLPRLALFALAAPDWKRRPGGQRNTWRKNLKRLTTPLAIVGSSRLPGWGPKDKEDVWLETLSVMAKQRTQWRASCNACIPFSQ